MEETPGFEGDVAASNRTADGDAAGMTPLEKLSNGSMSDLGQPDLSPILSAICDTVGSECLEKIDAYGGERSALPGSATPVVEGGCGKEAADSCDKQLMGSNIEISCEMSTPVVPVQVAPPQPAHLQPVAQGGCSIPEDPLSSVRALSTSMFGGIALRSRRAPLVDKPTTEPEGQGQESELMRKLRRRRDKVEGKATLTSDGAKENHDIQNQDEFDQSGFGKKGSGNIGGSHRNFAHRPAQRALLEIASPCRAGRSPQCQREPQRHAALRADEDQPVLCESRNADVAPARPGAAEAAGDKGGTGGRAACAAIAAVIDHTNGVQDGTQANAQAPQVSLHDSRSVEAQSELGHKDIAASGDDMPQLLAMVQAQCASLTDRLKAQQPSDAAASGHDLGLPQVAPDVMAAAMAARALLSEVENAFLVGRPSEAGAQWFDVATPRRSVVDYSGVSARMQRHSWPTPSPTKRTDGWCDLGGAQNVLAD